MPQTMWERLKTGGKAGFDKSWKALDKLGAPVNKLSNKLGSEAFWPTTLDKESDKAARILKSFCKDGFYAEEEIQPQEGPKMKQRVVQKIPEKVIQRAKGLAIFTTMRTGLWVSGAGGSGVLVARKQDGTWSPPSGILLHTAGLGFLVGIDIYDCVIVINTEEALQAFTKVRCTLGSEITVAAGPVGAGGVLDTELHKRQAPIYTYLKSRGFYAGVQIDGTIIIERTDENERFYGEKIGVQDILAGKARHPPYEIKRLMETIKSAQGDSNIDESLIPTEAPPGDYEIDDGHAFGVPDKDDPDPYGVLALEKEGMSLKEASTKKRASWEEFSFHPSPTSPVHNIVARNSEDRARSMTRRSSWRSSAFGNSTNDSKTSRSLRNSMDQPPAMLMTDSATQTDSPLDAEPSPSRRSVQSFHSSKGSISNAHHIQMQEVPENEVLDTSPERQEPVNASAANGYTTPPHTPPAPKDEPSHDDLGDDHDDDAAVIEDSVLHSVQTITPASPSVVSKARLVNVPKRVPPKLPPRNPNRSGPMVIDASTSPAVDENVTPTAAPGEKIATGEKTGDIESLKEQLDDVKLDDDEPTTKHEASPQKEVEPEKHVPGGFY